MMRLMPAQIALYEEMSALSRQMVEAARANDWNALGQLEHSVAALRESLRADDDNSCLNNAEIESKIQLIQRILADDAEVRRHTEPWMEQVRQFLGGNAKRRKVERTYSLSI